MPNLGPRKPLVGRVLVVLTPLVHLILAVWVGRDAARRGDNVPVWAVGTLIGGLFGLVAYLLRRRPTSAGSR